MVELDTVETVNNFIIENKIACIYFSSKDCNVCTGLLPKVEELLSKYNKIKSVKIDVDNFELIVGQFSVFTLPCIVLFVEGKETIREARFISIIQLEEKIQRFYDLI